MATATVRGLPELKRDLARLSDRVATRLGKNAVMAGARVVARHARANAPIATGYLKVSIKARRDPERSRRGSVIAYANTKLFYARFIELGTAHMSARPFLRPGLDEHVVEVREKMVSNLARGIDREIKKLPPAPEDVGEI